MYDSATLILIWAAGLLKLWVSFGYLLLSIVFYRLNFPVSSRMMHWIRVGGMMFALGGVCAVGYEAWRTTFALGSGIFFDDIALWGYFLAAAIKATGLTMLGICLFRIRKLVVITPAVQLLVDKMVKDTEDEIVRVRKLADRDTKWYTDSD